MKNSIMNTCIRMNICTITQPNIEGQFAS